MLNEARILFHVHFYRSSHYFITTHLNLKTTSLSVYRRKPSTLFSSLSADVFSLRQRHLRNVFPRFSPWFPILLEEIFYVNVGDTPKISNYAVWFSIFKYLFIIKILLCIINRIKLFLFSWMFFVIFIRD